MENKTSAFNLTIKGSVDIIFRHKMIMVIFFIVIIAFALLGLKFVTPVYDANVKMLVRGQSVTAAETYVPIMAFGIHSTQAQIVQSHPVLKRAVIALNLHNRPFDYEKNFSSDLKKVLIDYLAKKAENRMQEFPTERQQEMRLEGAISDLKARLTVNMLPGTDIFEINVKAFTPEEAIETANVISRSYTIFDQMQQLAEISLRYGDSHPTVVQLKDNIRYATINLSGRQLPDIQAIGTASVKIVEQATSTGYPVGKPKRMILAVALLAAGGISFSIAFAYGFFDRTLKTPQDIVTNLKIPCIGSIPVKKRKEPALISDDSPLTKYTEFYEDLAEQLYVFLKTQGLTSALVTSPVYNRNHQFIVPNIGYFLSQEMEHRTLLIDANFSSPRFQGIYSLQAQKTLANETAAEKPHSIINTADGRPDVILTAVMAEKPSAILKMVDLKKLLNQVKSEYDAILIDGTSINNFKDASAIAECCDGTVIVIDEGKVQRQMLKNSLPRLRRHDAILLGSILNNRTFPVPEFIYKNFKYFID